MVDPCDFVIFGGTGDLAVRKLLPALYLRDRDGQLPAETRIVAVARAGLDGGGHRDNIRGALPPVPAAASAEQARAGPRGAGRPPDPEDETVERFVARLSHVSLDIDDNDSWPTL